jgi:flagellin
VKAKQFQGRQHDRLMRINTNVASLQAQRAMSEHSKQVESASGKIAQGTRVRNAADDAASLAIGTKHKSEIRSNYQAMRNANDAISEFQIAEGTLNEVGSMVTRLKELSIQAANSTLTDYDRENLNMEYMELRSEIERMTQSAQFLGDNLFRSKEERSFQIGTNSDSLSRLEIDRSNMIVSEFNLQLVDSSIPTAEEAKLNLNYIDKAMEKLSKTRAGLGSMQNRLESTISNLDTGRVNESSALSQRMDADMAFETAEKIRNQIKVEAAGNVMGQAHQVSALALNLLKGNGF